ncbi:hypothetical protein Ahy_A09g041744 [Arachis hypogaea]|uniref:DUF4283 domain-containing protein n=1 Tax=Arachis hypogaea TaxID=3818 RepID=A0A445BDL8_ARAHY|nr:hypothetical protein Ahy_A09g041744 [Arachis hypogaea]
MKMILIMRIGGTTTQIKKVKRRNLLTHAPRFQFLEKSLRNGASRGNMRSSVGSILGHMLKIDGTTSIHSRGRFARICVEIDLAKKLIPRISVLGYVLNVEYEGLYQIYFSCGKYEQRSEQCTKLLEEQTDNQGSGATVVAATRDDHQKGKNQDPNNQHQRSYDQTPPNLGLWMMVKRPIKKKKGSTDHEFGEKIKG